MIDLQKLKLWLGALCVVCLAYLYWRSAERKAGALAAQITTLEASVKTLSHTADSLEAAFRVDTVRLTKQVSHTDTVLQTLIDSAIVEHHDTILVTREVLVQADSAIHACRVVLSECEAGWTAEKAISADLRKQLAATLQLQPSFLARHLALTAGYGLVDHGGVVYAGPSLVAGWKILP